MLWLIIAILAYLILAVVFLVDKYLLISSIPNPKVYTFYIGFLGILALFLIPFVGFHVPVIEQIILSFLSGALFIFGIFWFVKGLKAFEPSRIVPAVGGILPLFSFALIYIFSGGRETLGTWEILALLFLVFGSILITYEKAKSFSLKSFRISIITAFFLALSFVLAKYVYMVQPFWSGFILIKIGGFFMALIFLSFRDVKKEIFGAKKSLPKKTAGIFLLNQILGGSANILQNWSIALAPLAYIAFINALQGVQYVFLLVLAILLSWKFPKLLKEQISREVILQKIVAILLVSAGLVLLAF